jgi:hypothetical protein
MKSTTKTKMRVLYPMLLAIPKSVVLEPPKRCMDCKFYMNEFWKEKKFGKCALFPTEESTPFYLVDGERDVETDFHYCATARSSIKMCGEEGVCFQYK